MSGKVPCTNPNCRRTFADVHGMRLHRSAVHASPSRKRHRAEHREREAARDDIPQWQIEAGIPDELL